MQNRPPPLPRHPDGWPRPPSALVAERLYMPPTGARVTVAGLVILPKGSARPRV